MSARRRMMRRPDNRPYRSPALQQTVVFCQVTWYEYAEAKGGIT